jgi:hypothetical protein
MVTLLSESVAGNIDWDPKTKASSKAVLGTNRTGDEETPVPKWGPVRHAPRLGHVPSAQFFTLRSDQKELHERKETWGVRPFTEFRKRAKGQTRRTPGRELGENHPLPNIGGKSSDFPAVERTFPRA